MSTYRYLSPFAPSLMTMSQADVDGMIAQVAQGLPPQSMDDRRVCIHTHSDEVGFLPLVVHFNYIDEDDFMDSLEEVVRDIAMSQARGTRGARGVLIDTTIRYDQDDEAYIKIWVGRNVWYNKHRVTVGYPASEYETESVCEAVYEAFKHEGFDTECVDTVDDEDAVFTREEAHDIVRDLRTVVDRVQIDLARVDVNPEARIRTLLAQVREWANSIEEEMQG